MSERDEPTLVRVIPVNRRLGFAEGAVEVGSVEIWADAITVRYTSITTDPVGGELIRFGGVRVHDDVGTAYVGQGAGGGGSLQVVHFVRSFNPAPPVDASALYLTVVREGVEVEIDVPLAPAESPDTDRRAAPAPNGPELLRVVRMERRVGFDGGAVTVTSVEVWSDSILVHGLIFLVTPTPWERGRRTPPALRDDRGTACDSRGWGSVGDPDLEYVHAQFTPPDPDATMLWLTVTPHGRDAAVEIAIPFSP